MKEFFTKKKFIVLLLILFIFLVFKIFLGGEKSLSLKPDLFEFSKLSKQNIRSSVSATGTINPVNVISVGAQVSGIVNKIYVDYNDEVKTGQMLAEIDKALLIEDINSTNARMMQAKAQFDLATLEKNRTEELFNAGYIAKLELDQAITDLATAEANYIAAKADNERSKRNIGYAEIKSPVSGVVISKDVEEGQTIASSFSAPTLFTIAEDLTRMQIEASISEADIGNIKKGQNVSFTVDAFPLETFNGVVDQVRLSPTIDTNDYETKARAARKFLTGGDKVKVSCRFKGRMIDQANNTKGLFIKFATGLEDIAKIDQQPTLDGRNMTMMLSPIVVKKKN